MLERRPGHKALAHVKRILEQRPKKDDHELSFATQCLAEFRENLIGLQRPGPSGERDRECLSHLNAIISVVMGMHFPLGNAPWGEFEKAQGWLEDLVHKVET